LGKIMVDLVVQILHLWTSW